MLIKHCPSLNKLRRSILPRCKALHYVRRGRGCLKQEWVLSSADKAQHSTVHFRGVERYRVLSDPLLPILRLMTFAYQIGVWS